MHKGTVNISSMTCPVAQHAPLITSFECAQCERTVLLGLVIRKSWDLCPRESKQSRFFFFVCGGCVGVGMEGISCLRHQGGIPTFILLLEQI